MRIRLSNPERQPRLLGFLAFDPNAIATLISETEIEISFLGSLNEWAQRRELELRLRLWLAAHPDVVAVVGDSLGVELSGAARPPEVAQLPDDPIEESGRLLRLPARRARVR